MRRPRLRVATAAFGLVLAAAAFSAAQAPCATCDGKFGLRTPVAVEFPINQFVSMTHDGVELAKR